MDTPTYTNALLQAAGMGFTLGLFFWAGNNVIGYLLSKVRDIIFSYERN